MFTGCIKKIINNQDLATMGGGKIVTSIKRWPNPRSFMKYHPISQASIYSKWLPSLHSSLHSLLPLVSSRPQLRSLLVKVSVLLLVVEPQVPLEHTMDSTTRGGLITRHKPHTPTEQLVNTASNGLAMETW